MDTRITALLFAFCLPHAALAAQQDEPLVQVGEEPEVIIVNGRRYPFQLRMEMLAAERTVYDVFNQFIDEEKFRISCSTRQATGTRLPLQDCQPAFEREALRAEAEDRVAAFRAFNEPYMTGGVTGPSPETSLNTYSPFSTAAPAATVIAPQRRALQRKMREVAEAHPEFMEALIDYTNVKIRYNRTVREVNAGDE